MTKQTLMNSMRTLALAAMAAIPGLSCTYSVSVPAIPASGGYVYVSVNTQAGCAWTVSQDASFLSFASLRSGWGPGSVLVYARPNSGGARSGFVDVNSGGAATISPSLGGRSSVVSTTTALGPLVARTTAVQY